MKSRAVLDALQDFGPRQTVRAGKRNRRQADYYETAKRRAADGTAGTIRPQRPMRRV